MVDRQPGSGDGMTGGAAEQKAVCVVCKVLEPEERRDSGEWSQTRDRYGNQADIYTCGFCVHLARLPMPVPVQELTRVAWEESGYTWGAWGKWRPDNILYRLVPARCSVEAGLGDSCGSEVTEHHTWWIWINRPWRHRYELGIVVGSR